MAIDETVRQLAAALEELERLRHELQRFTRINDGLGARCAVLEQIAGVRCQVVGWRELGGTSEPSDAVALGKLYLTLEQRYCELLAKHDAAKRLLMRLTAEDFDETPLGEALWADVVEWLGKHA